MTNPYISVGYHKGEMDFLISAEVCNLSVAQMQDLRATIVAGIGTMEDMWRRERERLAPVAQTTCSDYGITR